MIEDKGSFEMARVLVVDDEKLIVKGIRFSLEQDGYEVDCAYDGEEAIEMAKKTEFGGCRGGASRECAPCGGGGARLFHHAV